MKVHVLLADKGTQNPQAGTLNLLNVGWGGTMIGAAGLTPPSAVALFLEAEFMECNRPLRLVLELLDQDGRIVTVTNGDQPQVIRIEQSVTVGIPVGVPYGAPGKANVLTEVHPGLPLAPGSYRWAVSVEGETRDEWSVEFHVIGPQPPPVFGGAPPE